MLGNQRKKHTSSNINININLKVENKQGLTGKKIHQQKEIQNSSQSIRPNQIHKHKKKIGMESHPTKQSIHQYLDDHPLESSKQENNNNYLNGNGHPERTLNNFKNTSRKRGKSKSLGNLKVRYYARTPEPLSKSNSKMTSKSKSKQTSKSKSKSKKKSEGKLISSPVVFHPSKDNKSKSKSKPKSKSPLMSKKRSLHTFRVSSRQLEKQKSREKKWEKNLNTFKKSQPSQPSFDKGMNILPKHQNKPSQKVKPRKSKDKLKPFSPQKKVSQTIIPQKSKQKKTKKQQKLGNIYPQPYLNAMAIKIQKVWKGYIVRKKFKEELNELTFKIKSIKKENIWQSHSNHSIIQLDSDFSGGQKNQKNISERSNSGSINPQFMIQLQKLRKKLEEQEDRFKVLAEENNQLKTNLSKINSQNPSACLEKKEKKPEKSLVVSQNVISMRIQSEQSDVENQDHRNEPGHIRSVKKRREKILQLDVAIKTEESKEEIQLSDLKKKIEHFECSPRNQDHSIFKFNKNLIKKLFSQQEQKLNEKYFKKNNDYKTLLQNQLISPKSFNKRCCEWEVKLKKQKEDTIKKYKEAQKAMLLVAELQNQEHISPIPEKQNEESNKKNTEESPVFTHKRSHETSQHSTPQKKTINLFLNVDEIDENHEKYTPIISHNSYRQHELQIERQADLSQLYHQVMQDKASNIYLHQCPQQQHKHQILENRAQMIEQIERNQQEERNNMEIAQYPEFKIEFSKQPTIHSFQTSLKYIRLFYIKFCEFFREIPSFKDQILTNISQEITFDPQIYLRSLRAHKEDEDIEYCPQLIFPYFKLIGTYNNAIPVQMLNAFYSELTNPDSQQLFSKQLYEMKQTSHDQYRQLGYSIYQLKQYYDLALIDAFNEAINYERPGRAQASNLDHLTHQYRAIYKERIKSKISPKLSQQERENNLNSILGNTIGRIVNIWAHSLCGFINNCKDDDEDKIDDEEVEDIRMHRLTLYLEKSLIQDDHNLTNIKPFQLFVKVQLTNVILQALIEEVFKSIKSIQQDR